jgi:hypothetical protein
MQRSTDFCPVGDLQVGPEKTSISTGNSIPWVLARRTKCQHADGIRAPNRPIVSRNSVVQKLLQQDHASSIVVDFFSVHAHNFCKRGDLTPVRLTLARNAVGFNVLCCCGVILNFAAGATTNYSSFPARIDLIETTWCFKRPASTRNTARRHIDGTDNCAHRQG